MKRAFTVIELLVVIAIIALVLGILLPAIGRARDQAKVSVSQANLRNLAVAHGAYASEWNDRQLTFVDDNLSTYADGFFYAFGTRGYWGANGGRGLGTQHPPIVYGWAHTPRGYTRVSLHSGYFVTYGALTTPVVFDHNGCEQNATYVGAFRLINAEQFHQYVGGRFYDEVFYAPKDTVVRDAAGPCFESPDQFCVEADVNDRRFHDPAVWSSYVLSPAAMFSPDVMRGADPETIDGGFQSPWRFPAGFRSPSFSMCRYPSLKTHMLEHHWLQNTVAECNPNATRPLYGTPPCEPYYFNHAWESSPMTLFYDGHVESIGTRRTMRADGRLRTQTGGGFGGLWSRDTPWGEDGYLISQGYDQAATSYHILTTDGIRGRDLTAE